MPRMVDCKGINRQSNHKRKGAHENGKIEKGVGRRLQRSEKRYNATFDRQLEGSNSFRKK